MEERREEREKLSGRSILMNSKNNKEEVAILTSCWEELQRQKEKDFRTKGRIE